MTALKRCATEILCIFGGTGLQPCLHNLIQLLQSASARQLQKHRCQFFVLAAGHPHTLTGDMIKPGCVVIDVGTNRVEDAQAEKGYRWVGDADFDSVKEIAGMITPVPGGVGPMTIAMLLKNTVRAAKLLHQK